MGYKTYTHQLNSLRQDIIASIKEYLRKNVGNGAKLDIKEQAIMCDDYEIRTLATDWLTVRHVRGELAGSNEKLKYEAVSTDDLRRIHSLLVTGSEKI
jgi:hypothetical protein